MSSEPRTPAVASRLPRVGTTIFSVMSALAQQHGAVNLGQGFPDFDCDPRLVDAVTRAMRAGHNQYPPMAGVPALREAIAAKIDALYGHRYDAGDEITVTVGATQAILTAILAIVHAGDDVIVLEPAYDSYEPGIVLAGGRAVHVALTPGSFRPDFAAIAAAIGPRTRALILNTPHNPSATAWTADEMRQLRDLLRPTDIVVIADEVYEHMVYDGRRHESVSRDAELAARCIVVSSFGKTFHVTGWKVGYAAAPKALMGEFRKVHQFNVFTVHAPTQHALAQYMADPAPYLELAAFYAARRDHFRAGLARTRLRLLPSEGSYFQCVDYSAVGSEDEAAFCRRLTTQLGVAAIPLSAFYARPFEQRIVRFCYAKQTSTLDAALDRLTRL